MDKQHTVSTMGGRTRTASVKNSGRKIGLPADKVTVSVDEVTGKLRFIVHVPIDREKLGISMSGLGGWGQNGRDPFCCCWDQTSRVG